MFTKNLIKLEEIFKVNSENKNVNLVRQFYLLQGQRGVFWKAKTILFISNTAIIRKTKVQMNQIFTNYFSANNLMDDKLM